MPRRKPKPGKIAIVVFLTVLIWVWADLALDETPPPRRARIEVADSSEDLWVSFARAPHIDVQVTLSGPHSAFNELNRLVKKQTTTNRLDLVFDATREKMDQPGSHKLVLFDFLQKNEQLRRLGLKVKDCDPNSVTVSVVKLVKKLLPVECVNEAGQQLTRESITALDVEMFAPESSRTATVQLSQREIEAARSEVIEKQPYVLLAPGQKRLAPSTVKIKLAANESPLNQEVIEIPRPGIVFSPAMQGEYKVKMDASNLQKFLGQIQIRATPIAKQAYQDMPYHAVLEIYADDVEPGKKQARVLRYLLPEEFVRTNQIVLNQQPVEVEFELIKISTENP